jgi:hypothetical protein
MITLMLNIHFSLPLPTGQKLLNTETDTNNTPSPRLKLIHFHQSVSKWQNTFVASRNRDIQNIQVAKRSKISAQKPPSK